MNSHRPSQVIPLTSPVNTGKDSCRTDTLLIGWSLQGKSALKFMHIKSCVLFNKLGTVVLYLGVVVIGKKTPQLKISKVKWYNNNTSLNFLHIFLFFSIHLHNLPNYTTFSYFESKFLSRNIWTEYQFWGKNDWIWAYP